MLAHMRVRAHEFRANFRAKALESILLRADGSSQMDVPPRKK